MSATPVLRILVKLSGEALAGDSEFGIDPQTIRRFAREVAASQKGGVEVALVLGGGNLFRGAKLADAGLGRVTGDHMGMLATVMNALAFRDVLQSLGIASTVLSALPIADQSDAPGGHLVLIGGGDRPGYVMERIAELAGGSAARVLVVPLANPAPDQAGPALKEELQLVLKRIEI